MIISSMDLRELSAEEFRDVYNQYLVKDFPPNEVKPLERILNTMESGLCSAYGLFDGNVLKGYAVLILPEGLEYGLLDYLAIIKEYRNMGAGHAFFELIGDTLVRKASYLKGLFIESEKVESASNEAERTIREKRISFYIQNHCEMTLLGARLFGVTYSILLYRLGRETDDFRQSSFPTIADLDKIYLAMFKEHHYESRVALWKEEAGE